MTRGFFFTSILAIFIIVSCENPKKLDPVELEDPSLMDKNSQVNLNDIETIYRYKCSICHGKEGVSIIDGVPDLVLNKRSIEERVAIILNGSGTMPPQKDVLDMPTIRGLAVFIDSFE